MVSDEERLMDSDDDPTIHEEPVCIRRSHQLQGHLDAIKIVDLIKEKFVPNLWVHDDTGYYEKRDVECIKESMNLLDSFAPPASRSAPAP